MSLEAIGRRDAGAVLAIADSMEARSLSFENALGELARILHRVALAQAAPEAVPEDTPDRERILALAGALDPEDVQLYYQIALHGRQDLPLAPGRVRRVHDGADADARVRARWSRETRRAPGRRRAPASAEPAAAAPQQRSDGALRR